MSGPNIPPGNPTMAPPPLPPPSSTQGSRSSSPRKRKRDDSSPRRSTASSDFSMSVKNKIQASVIDSGKCWHCKASPGEYSHVIASRDPDFSSLRERGLTNLTSLNHEDNGIYLCPLCHTNYDTPSRAGFIFFPSDIQYFVEFEKKDYARRKQLWDEKGGICTRIVPSGEKYRQTQVEKELVDAEAIGGLYRRFVLRDFMPVPPYVAQWSRRTGEVYGPAPWHGDPLAAFAKAFPVAASVFSSELPSTVRTSLQALCNLYLEHDHLMEEAISEGSSHATNNRSRPIHIGGTHSQPRTVLQGEDNPAQDHTPSNITASAITHQQGVNYYVGETNANCIEVFQQPSPPASSKSCDLKLKHDTPPSLRSQTFTFPSSSRSNSPHCAHNMHLSPPSEIVSKNTTFLSFDATHPSSGELKVRASTTRNNSTLPLESSTPQHTCLKRHRLEFHESVVGEPLPKQRKTSVDRNKRTQHWKWGPMATAADVVRFYTDGLVDGT